ncbi:MAG: futalosine hydrolase [Desulfobacteraceae bacterium]|nr:futalosine hydrolase [Desulfobacteraceae bacterium]
MREAIILAATRMEIAPLLEESTVKRETRSTVGRPVIGIEHGGRSATVVITGPGMVNTAQALTMAMERFRPDLVIQTGIAGVFDKAGLRPGDIGVAESEHYIHTGLDRGESFGLPAPLPFDLIEADPGTRMGRFPVDPILADHALAVIRNGFADEPCRVIKGPFITVSTITATDATADRLFSAYTPCMEAMEGAASAQIAALYKVKFLEIRAGSNRVGKRDKTQWEIPLAAKRASRAVSLVLEKRRMP